ncbi:MAG: hypothetical protein OQL28_08265 [Sedimenticola sp.]|nr:hypothetical protein [Sedimenticola sp.]
MHIHVTVVRQNKKIATAQTSSCKTKNGQPVADEGIPQAHALRLRCRMLSNIPAAVRQPMDGHPPLPTQVPGVKHCPAKQDGNQKQHPVKRARSEGDAKKPQQGMQQVQVGRQN